MNRQPFQNLYLGQIAPDVPEDPGILRDRILDATEKLRVLMIDLFRDVRITADYRTVLEMGVFIEQAEEATRNKQAFELLFIAGELARVITESPTYDNLAMRIYQHYSPTFESILQFDERIENSENLLSRNNQRQSRNLSHQLQFLLSAVERLENNEIKNQDINAILEIIVNEGEQNNIDNMNRFYYFLDIKIRSLIGHNIYVINKGGGQLGENIRAQNAREALNRAIRQEVALIENERRIRLRQVRRIRREARRILRENRRIERENTRYDPRENRQYDQRENRRYDPRQNRQYDQRENRRYDPRQNRRNDPFDH